MESKLLIKQKPYSLQIDNVMSFLNELFFMAVLVLLWAIHELGETWVSCSVLPWITIALVGLVNLVNLVAIPILVCLTIKKAKLKRRNQVQAQALTASH